MIGMKSLPARLTTVAAHGLLVCAMSAISTICIAVPAAAPASGSFQDPLDTAALPGINPAQQPIMATALAGHRLMGVGMRGLIVASDDNGKTWRQIAAPVQSDLTSVMFPTPSDGWVVGHDGVILHSSDGGNSWTKQLDGVSAAKQFGDYYREQVKQGNASAEVYAKAIDQNLQAGPNLPYLDVWFDSPAKGYAVGAFGMLAATEDGGKTWLPWLDHIDNPDLLNLNAIRAIGGELYIAGERGMVYRLDRGKNRFVRMASGYKGSFFGIAGSGDVVVTFGLRGNVYRSTDRGATWQVSTTPAAATATAAATVAAGRMVMVTSAGAAWQGSGSMDNFKPLALAVPDSFTSITALPDGQVLLGGMNGIRVQSVPSIKQ
jgi:photosystem II stability/assembly factor-like uncharacterized protein